MNGLRWVLVAVLWSAGAWGDFFVKSKTIPVGPNPCAVAVGDLNGDGLPEIVTADRGTLMDPMTAERPGNDELSLLVGQENLSFARQPLKVDFGPYALALANVDTERAPDIVAVCFHATRNQDLLLLRNLGKNLFEPRPLRVADDALSYYRKTDSDGNRLYPTPGLTSVVVRDFNGDGFRDAVATGWCSDVIAFFPGNAETFLGEARLTEAPGGPRDVQAADFNSDGRLDLATTQYSSGEIALWEGDGKGGFVQAARFSSRGRLPHKIQIEDVNGDKKPDLLVSQCHTEDCVVVFYGGGDGFDFSLSQEVLLGDSRETLEQEIRDLVADDLDGNGRGDFVAACYGSGQVVVMLNVSADSSLPQKFRRENYTFDGAKPRALCVADLNGDEEKDVAVALWEPDAVALLLGAKKEKEAEKSTKDKGGDKGKEKAAVKKKAD